MADGNICITREIHRITRFNLSCIRYATRCKIPAFVGYSFYAFELTYIDCICIIDTSFDIYDTASDTSFTRLPYRFTDRNNAIIAITRQDVSLFYLAGIAKSGRIFRTRNIRIVTNG